MISQETIDYSDFMAQNSFLAKPKRKGHIRLYNKNAWKTTYYKIVEQCANKRAFIVERKSRVDPYWKHLVFPSDNNQKSV